MVIQTSFSSIVLVWQWSVTYNKVFNSVSTDEALNSSNEQLSFFWTLRAYERHENTTKHLSLKIHMLLKITRSFLVQFKNETKLIHFSIFKFDMLKTKVATNTKESINLVWSDYTFKNLISLIRFQYNFRFDQWNWPEKY